MTPGAYLKHRRTAHGLGVHDVAAVLATEPRLAEHVRAEWLEQIEADIVPMSFNTIVALRRAFTFDLDILAQLAAITMHSPVEPPRLCRICACSEADACLGHRGACSWIEHDLCSACFALRMPPAYRPAIAAVSPSASDVAA
ncbi:XRE family transcriptional regulator [Sphingomonas aerolata]|uniref:XRE family transcriptional regulator n=1 Tax=Sphingomonas aerolata TaxID=185951 RepID=UPI0033639B1F